MGQPITAEQHNQTRRAVKAKQRANRRAAAKGKVAGGPPATGGLLQQAKRDRARHARKLEKQAANEARLLAELDAKRILLLRKPNRDDYDGSTDGWFEEMQDYEYACQRHDMDVADVKRAAKRSPNRYQWDTTDQGFVIAKTN